MVKIIFLKNTKKNSSRYTLFTFWPPGPELALYLMSNFSIGIYPVNFSSEFEDYKNHKTPKFNIEKLQLFITLSVLNIVNTYVGRSC